MDMGVNYDDYDNNNNDNNNTSSIIIIIIKVSNHRIIESSGLPIHLSVYVHVYHPKASKQEAIELNSTARDLYVCMRVIYSFIHLSMRMCRRMCMYVYVYACICIVCLYVSVST